MNKNRHLTIKLEEQSLNIKISSRASKALEQRKTPLIVEMELLFSCMIRKKLRFNEVCTSTDMDCVSVNDRLSVGFKPVMTKRCSMDDVKGPPPTTDFPIARKSKFIPHWLHIDFHKGQWQGEFGYLLEN